MIPCIAIEPAVLDAVDIEAKTQMRINNAPVKVVTGAQTAQRAEPHLHDEDLERLSGQYAEAQRKWLDRDRRAEFQGCVLMSGVYSANGWTEIDVRNSRVAF